MCTSAAVRHTGVVISSTDCISSGATCASNSPSSVTRASIESMCCTRSHVSGSRSMYSSSTPSVYGSPEPKRWSSTLAWSVPSVPVIEAG